jgi:hypothetical protein
MPRGKTQKSLDLIEACRAILREIQPASVRAVCYQLFVRQLIESMAKNCTNRVSEQIVYARKQRIIPWPWIVDDTRKVHRPVSWRDAGEYVETMLTYYRRERWQDQPIHVEVWSEKSTVSGTLAPVLEKYGVPWNYIHGYTSWTNSHDAAREFRRLKKPCVILYVGDHDPSGKHMSDVDIPERFAWEGVTMALRRLAILEPRARALQLPSFPASDKRSDSRYQWFLDHHGDTCWELDALSPAVLRETVQLAIEEYIDWDAWKRAEEVEAAEKRSMDDFLATWNSAHG